MPGATLLIILLYIPSFYRSEDHLTGKDGNTEYIIKYLFLQVCPAESGNRYNSPVKLIASDDNPAHHFLRATKRNTVTNCCAVRPMNVSARDSIRRKLPAEYPA